MLPPNLESPAPKPGFRFFTMNWESVFDDALTMSGHWLWIAEAFFVTKADPFGDAENAESVQTYPTLRNKPLPLQQVAG
jgi:hypothetical protein